ncbi:MAG: ATP-binding protein [Myxococcota bacterium]|nr:ATP-binding protein [Myxococcota bacterium]
MADLETAAATFDEAGARCSSTADFDALTATHAQDLSDFLSSLAVRPSERALLRSRVDEALGHGIATQTLVHLSRPDGTEATLAFCAVRSDFEGAKRLVVTVQNTSNGSRLRQELDSLARLAAVGQMTVTVAHEINNIVTAMLGWTDIARRSANAATVVLPALEILEANAKRAKTLVGRLLHRTRTEPVVPVSLHLSTVVEDALRLLSWELSDSGIRVVTALETIPPVLGDEEQLHQVIVNLVRNAKDAMPGGGTLTVGLTLLADGPVLTFEDSGEGIPDEVLPRIFDPFFSTKGCREPSLPGGSGLGLAVCRDIVSDFGGRIAVSSRVGAGTKFSVHLRAASSAPKEQTPMPEEPDDGFSGAKVLVVDDEKDVGEMISTALSLKGARVRCASRGDEAIALCETQPFEVAFVDFSMPGLSGRELLVRLRRAQPTMPLVVMSGREIEIEGLERVVDFLKKPFELRDVEAKLRSVLLTSSRRD